MLKVGIIGCGKISEVRHAPEYFENPNCEITAYFDEIPERAEKLAMLYGGTVYSSIDDLLKSGVDALSVCTANTAHAAGAIAALNADVHVLCEKPMATTLEDCEAMTAAAENSGKFLMIGQNQRFSRAHVQARKLIVAGEIGRVITFRTTFGHPGPEGWTGVRDSWFFDKKRAAFGAMADLGVHKTDLLHYLLGEPVTQVTAQIAALDKTMSDGTKITVDDNAFCIYRTKSGIIGTLHVSWTFYGEEDNSTIIYGTKGVIRCYADKEYGLIVEKRDGSTIKYALDQMTSNKDQTSGGRTNTGVIDHFIDCILENRQPSINGKEALKVMKVIFAAEKSALTGKTVNIRR